MTYPIYRDNFRCLTKKFLSLTGQENKNPLFWGPILEEKYVNNQDIINKIVNNNELQNYKNEVKALNFIELKPLPSNRTFYILTEIVQQNDDRNNLRKLVKNKEIIKQFQEIFPYLFFNDIKNYQIQ